MNTKLDNDQLLTVNGQILFEDKFKCVAMCIPNDNLARGLLEILDEFTLGIYTDIRIVPTDIAIAGSGATPYDFGNSESKNKIISNSHTAYALFNMTHPKNKDSIFALRNDLYSGPLFFHIEGDSSHLPHSPAKDGINQYFMQDFKHVRPEDQRRLEKRVWHEYLLNEGFYFIQCIKNVNLHKEMIDHVKNLLNGTYTDLRVISAHVVPDPKALELEDFRKFIEDSHIVYVKLSEKGEKQFGALRSAYIPFVSENSLYYFSNFKKETPD